MPFLDSVELNEKSSFLLFSRKEDISKCFCFIWLKLLKLCKSLFSLLSIDDNVVQSIYGTLPISSADQHLLGLPI